MTSLDTSTHDLTSLSLDEALRETFHAAEALQDLLRRTAPTDAAASVFERMLRHECRNAESAALVRRLG